ncbi:uncharacterized protein Pyn_15008 [Prunus yedoensis var. nudiflora]|uniref:Bromo domain-containing protein n=1 Tax=Prunus yedoensis var. nudiflora TaxID=2094558 RepID=A0A314UQ38_PRUYE|nr:uncharacterized protein Pyn_15008 [Prunus yedoensis var. nudiflora]
MDDVLWTMLREESDIFLICSNAMQYNAPDTIYFRQARSIHELAKKNFDNLRQDSDDNEPGPKVVRRGRPPTKNLKKPLGRPSLERAGSEFSDATLATGAENANYDLRKGPQIILILLLMHIYMYILPRWCSYKKCMKIYCHLHPA